MKSNLEEWVPSALREVWEWKEAVARDHEGESTDEMLRRMEESSEAALRARGINLQRVGVGHEDAELRKAAR